MYDADVIVIGAGASGLMCAGISAQQGQTVLLLEKKSRPAIKLSITGKGRCNITNSKPIKEFINEFGNNGKFLYSAFSKFFNTDTINFFEELGVRCSLERGGRYFPKSNNAYAVVKALIKFVKSKNVKIIIHSQVEKFVLENKQIKNIILKDGTTYTAKNYVLATGGKSYPLTGSTGDGYKIAQALGHTIIAPQPALVPLVSNDQHLKQLNKLKLKNIEISVIANNDIVSTLFGEIEFTIFGLTGPLILKVSSKVYSLLKEKKSIEISINLKPALDDKQLDARLIRELNNFGNLPIRNMLKTLLPLQLIEPFMKKNNIKYTQKCSSIINKEKRKKLLDSFRKMKFKIISTRPIDEAIITKGGISLKEVDQKTMKSKLIDNLYFCGEILDIDGPTGGFNLQAAFSTGYLAGISII